MKNNLFTFTFLTLLVFSVPMIYSFFNSKHSLVLKNTYETVSSEISSGISAVGKEKKEEAQVLDITNNYSKIDSKSETTLLFVGDIMLSRAIGRLMQEKNDWNFPFANLADFLRKADLTFGNLEGPISNNGYDTGSLYSFRVDPRVVDGLLFAGFDVLSVANNHMFDYSSIALKDTFEILKKNKISYVGGGYSYQEAHNPVIKNINGLRVAFLAYTNLLPKYVGEPGASPAIANFNRDQIVLDLAKAKEDADFVIVSFHWGEEYKTKANIEQKDLAYFVIDNGANLVIGHHPHVVQEVEKYKESYIVYSLGNFIFDQNFSADTRNGLVLEVNLVGDNISNVKGHRIEFNKEYQPYFVVEN